MKSAFVYSVDPYLVAVVFTVLFIAVAEIGYQIAGRFGRHGEDISQLEALEGAVFALLSLLLALTFAGASSRYDMRRLQVVDEANAMGTAYLRTQTLPEPYRTRTADVLREYLNVQIAYFSLRNERQLSGLIRRTNELQQRLWSLTRDVAVAHQDSEVIALYETSVNEVIDMQAKRLAIFLNRVPETIWRVQSLIAMVAFFVVGYLNGLNQRRQMLIRILAAIMVALVIAMIVDLDRPLAGPTRISPQPLIDVRDSMPR